MKSRIPVAAASAAIALICAPVICASSTTSRHLQAPGFAKIGESDPWVPDNRQPPSMLQGSSRTTVLAPDTSGAVPAPAAVRLTWRLRLLRLVRFLRLGGILR